MKAIARLFGLLLRVYPARVRDRFGSELHAALEAVWDEERPSRSAAGRLLLLLRLVIDTVAAGVAFRLDPVRLARPTFFKGSDMRALPYDLRLAVRSLAKAPGFSITAIAVLAIGLGICTVVFTVAQHVLLRPLPYPDPDRLVMLWDVPSTAPEQHSVVSPGNVADWRAESRSFAGVAVFNVSSIAVDHDGGRERHPGASVTANYFDVLGVQPRLGRAFEPPDEAQGAAHVIVISDGFWKRQLGADPLAIGRTLVAGTRTYRVIGVMPPGFEGPEAHFFGRSDFWAPAFGTLTGRGGHYLRVVARLRDGISVEQARGELALIAERSAKAYPSTNRDWTATVVPLRDEIVGQVRPVLLILLAAVFVVQLTVCANVAGLLLSRSVSRTREYAIRSAIGASALRLVQGVAAEAILLAGSAALAGLVFASWLCRALVTLGPDIPRITGIGLDPWAVVFAVVLSSATAVLAGAVPALGAVRVDPARALQDSGRTSTSVSRRRIRRVLVVAELAASVVLLIGAGLLTHSYVRLVRTPVGFSPAHVTTARVGLVPEADDGANARQAAGIADAIRALPGVEDAGVSTSLPLYGLNNVGFGIDARTPDGTRSLAAYYRAVTPGYMRAIQLQLTAGRLLDESDGGTAPGAIVLSEDAARRLGIADPLRVPIHFEFGGRAFDGVVVGVVRGVRHDSPLEPPAPEFYVPYAQHPVLSPLMVAVRSGAPLAAADVSAAIRRVNQRLTVDDVQPMAELVAHAVAPQQFNALLLLLLAGIALVLATIGLYAVIAQTVAQRVREIGIRLALGARRAQVFRLVLSEGLTLAITGIVLGTVVAFSFAAVLGRLLFAVSSHDPAVFASVPLILLAVAIAAVWIPARRASATDPVVALRGD